MRQPLIWGILAVAVLSPPVHAQSQYVGVKACARCHDSDRQGNAFHVWQTSKHAEAFGPR